MNKLQEITTQFEQALSAISFENLDISDEVKEQVKIHHLTFLLHDYRGHQQDSSLSFLSLSYSRC